MFVAPQNSDLSVCYRSLHNGRCDNYCRYHKGHNLANYIDIDNENVSEVPCRFLLKSSGCLGLIKEQASIVTNWRTGQTLTAAQVPEYYEECRHNHFYKPHYVCEVFLYNSSLPEMDHKQLPHCHHCGKLHISWENFATNMFNSRVDGKRKRRSMNFLVAMIAQLAIKSDYRKTIFDDFITIHKNFKETLKDLHIAYNSKCITCHLPPHLPKLIRPKTYTIQTLTKMKRRLPHDIIRLITSYMYDQHNLQRNGCLNCHYLVEKTYQCNINEVMGVSIYRASRVGKYGVRAVAYRPPYDLQVDLKGIVHNSGGKDIECYTQLEQNEIWKFMIAHSHNNHDN